MRKQYILILSVLFFILTISCVSAVDNDTCIVKEQNNDVISINEQDSDSISLSEEENEPVSAINENNSTILTITNEDGILASDNNSEVLAVSSSEEVLSSEVTVAPLSSSDYETPTKKQRTFNIGGFKAVLTNSQYKKLYKVSSVEDIFFESGDYEYYETSDHYKGYYVTNTGLCHYAEVKTNKFVKVKVKIGNKYYIRKTRARMFFAYGGGQCGVPYKYMIFLTHKYANPGYDYSKVLGKSAKYFKKCKLSASFTKLNKSKLYSPTYVYKKYGDY